MKTFDIPKRIAVAAALLTLVLLPQAADVAAQAVSRPSTVDGWADRLGRFGKGIPQEKVFLHMDNTCYFLGDTIWFAAYTRRTDTGFPSAVSRVLYVELLNQEGYLVERQLVEMHEGCGHGQFALADTLYGGFYELRAYTRWQLNWGQTEKAHTPYAEQWFFSKDMAQEFYRDYEKLYSRVFPVYDAPQRPGEFFHDMSTRPLRRYFSSGAKEPQLTLALFPEGGGVAAGVPCRVAFEAATETGEWQEGRLELLKGNEVINITDITGTTTEAVPAVSRGRGLFAFTPEAGQRYKARFTAADGSTATADLPVAAADGVALSVVRDGDAYVVNVRPTGAARRDLGLTLMHEGLVEAFETVAAADAAAADAAGLTFRYGADALKAGVNQATVFDADGRVWADRLFFVGAGDLVGASLSVSGLKDYYEPFEEVALELQGAPSTAHISLSVRDEGTADNTFDTSDILTEMLLSSEIRGYVPDPRYFFEADDAEHRTALDLLMLTQGWRRFSWTTMAVPEAFSITQPNESQTQILRGQVLNYTTHRQQDDVERFDDVATPYMFEEQISRLAPGGETDFLKSLEQVGETPSPKDLYENGGFGELIEVIRAEVRAKERHFPSGSYQMNSLIAAARYNESERPLSREVRLHAEFTQPGSESVVGDMDTRQGLFTIPTPRFEGFCVFFLAASDTTTWKSGQHTWIDMDDTKQPEYYVRIAWPYPRFTQPYNHYHTAYRQPAADSPQASQTSYFNPKTFETQMGDITVRASHGGYRRHDASHPALTVDAYEAFNEVCDAGLATGWYGGRIHFTNSIARAYIGDMNTAHAYLLEPRYDGMNISLSRSAQKINRFNQLANLDSIRIYTDFHPRYGADPRATEDNVDRVGIDLLQLRDDGQRVAYRDRRYVLQGFNVAEDFYSPDYSRSHPLSPAADYRRTLYWNPDLQLDAEGRAAVRFYTGSRGASLTVDANGQTADGKPITN